MSLHDAFELPSETQVPGVYWDEAPIGPVVGPSFWDERVLGQIEEHLALEAGAASAYETLSGSSDPDVTYLAGLIAEDERRHHEVLSTIAEELRSRLSERVKPAQPKATMSTEEIEGLRQVARRLLEMEASDAAALKVLRHDLREAPEDTMWPALVEMMQLDTDKHIRLLKAIEGHLRLAR